MDSRLKNLLWFGVSTAIIAAAVYFADFGEFLGAVRRANTWYLVPAFALGLSSFGIWSYVWYSFFKTMELRISYLKSFWLFMAGHFMNSITPAGQFGGEPFMAYIISRNTDASYEKAFSTVISADIVNAVPSFTFVLGGAFYLMLFGSINQLVLQAVYMSLLVIAVGGVLVYLLWFKSGRVEEALIRFSRFISDKTGRGAKIADTIEEKLRNVQESFRRVGESPWHLVKVTAISHLIFIFQIGCLYFILLSLGVEPDIAPLYFVLSLSLLAIFAPTPGGSGAVEAAMAGLLNFFISMSFASAVAAAIIFRLTTYWPGLIVGYIAINTLENGGS